MPSTRKQTNSFFELFQRQKKNIVVNKENGNIVMAEVPQPCLSIKDKDNIIIETTSSLKSGFETELESVTDSSTLTSSSLASATISNIEKQDTIDFTNIEYPEGGLRSWLVVLGCFCGLFTCLGLLNAIGIVETYIQENQLSNESSSSIGWIFSLLLFVNFSSCIFSGTYFDRNGFKIPVIVGTILHVCGLVAMANSTKLWQFILSLSIAVGLGNGFIMSPLISAPSHYFNKRRGLATALATLGGSIGGVILPIMLKHFFRLKNSSSKHYGFIWGIRVWAFMDLGLLIVALFLAKERFTAPIAPLDDNDTKFKRTIRIYFLESFDIKAFKDMRYLFCVLGTTFGEVALNTAVTYYGAYATNRNISNSDALMLIMVLNILSIPGRWLPGYISDLYGRFNMAILTMSCLTILMFVGWVPFGTNLTNLYVISAFFGFCSGSVYSLLPVCCGQISKIEEFGKRYSSMYFVVAFANLIAVPITGAIIGNGSNTTYRNFVIFCGSMAFASATSFVISRYYCIGMKFKKF
ncbi:hypothetical protein TBLA_0A01270 [Henningerozyma blattae CBS 6284]|uniref:Major facilitator superfamily (MFS) profile domain-containing protein n=1 Tax=Henningerozyma blattae (strain ATCC 34711 / CBS 6284 / DSM 70876 / NBRC 10599 / NRRL Y-10934 / UCD 77-7) TaxID=1071380 RepID=I2GUX4_HENB6|nr:hypothetical protein TBLA_0A01270 [Tetrapisispora blattae CBS 6284]CCH57926.1 hypothetical protein TBLA_0A01270 [Tetrapisispora blattae CBS 6284]